MLRATLLLIGVLILCPARTEAAVTGDWGRYAAVASHFHVPLPNAYVHTSDCPMADGAGCADPDTGEVWLSADSDRFALAHELGHVFDRQNLTDRDHVWLRRLMHAPAGEWWSEWGADEWFADYYATCALGGWPRHSYTAGYISYQPPNLQRVCNAITVWGIMR